MSTYAKYRRYATAGAVQNYPGNDDARPPPALKEVESFISPSVASHLDFGQAQHGLNTPRMQSLRSMSDEIDKGLGLQSQHLPAIGAWSDGAEPSMIVHTMGSPEAVRAATAMKAALANQKQALVFNRDPGGQSFLASTDLPVAPDVAHKGLLQAGIPYHTLEPTGQGTRVHVFGDNQGQLTALERLAGLHGSQVAVAHGNGEFIGTQKNDGTDEEQRADAQSEYDKIIRQVQAGAEQPGRDFGTLWNHYRNRWASLPGAKDAYAEGGATDDDETDQAIEPEEGFTAYHGSPHDFDQFDASKFGTGEGTAAYGRGLYVAQNENVAKTYRQRALRMNDAPPGHMYETRVGRNPDAFLDWDTPMRKQSASVFNALGKTEIPYIASRIAPNWGDMTGGDFWYKVLRMGFPPGQIESLAKAGIPGIRYLDKFSRQGTSPPVVMPLENGAFGVYSSTTGDMLSYHRTKEDAQREADSIIPKEPTYNYVLFDPSAAKITRKYASGGSAWDRIPSNTIIPRDTEILENPSQEEMRQFADDYGEVRMLRGSDNTIYAWPASATTHDHMAYSLGLKLPGLDDADTLSVQNGRLTSHMGDWKLFNSLPRTGAKSPDKPKFRAGGGEVKGYDAGGMPDAADATAQPMQVAQAQPADDLPWMQDQPAQPQPVQQQAPQAQPQQQTGDDLPWMQPGAQENADPSSGGFVDTVATAAKNVPGSALNAAYNMVQPIIHPINFAEGLAHLGAGAFQKGASALGMDAGHSYEKYADALGQFFKERYGSADAIRHTFENDPVGMALDLATALGFGEAAVGSVAKGLSMLGAVDAATTASKISGGLGTAAKYTNPMTPIVAGTKAAAKTAMNFPAGALGVASGVGADAVKQSFRSGYEGPESLKAFQGQMRGTDAQDIIKQEGLAGLQQFRVERGAAYNRDMAALGGDTTVLPFDEIYNAYHRALQVHTFHGEDLSPTTVATRDALTKLVDNWAGKDPTIFHTPIGLDALKKQMGDVLQNTPEHTPSRLIAGDLYHSVVKTIEQQAPQYADIMREYGARSDLIDEIERGLRMNDNATVEQTVRKLSAAMRDNVNTNYGYVKDLAEELSRKAPMFMHRIAGLAMKSPTPRGGFAAHGAEMGAFGAALSGHWHALAALPVTSPRIQGEVLSQIGRGAGMVGKPLQKAGQAVSPYLPTMPPGHALAAGAAEAGQAMGAMGQADGGRAEEALARTKRYARRGKKRH